MTSSIDFYKGLFEGYINKTFQIPPQKRNKKYHDKVK